LKMALRILVVDDHEPTRRAITSILGTRADWHVCGEASDGIDAIAQAKELRPDAVLMDVSMPRMDGLQATREVRQHLPTAKIVIVSQNDLSVVRQQAEQVHADAYVGKDKLTQQLIPSIAGLFPEVISKTLDPSTKASGEEVLARLQGDGEMGELIRNTDWGQTRLGPVANWSPALRMIVKFLLANRFPQLLWWGPEFCSVYNDAYIPILGSKHPWALGRPVREVWNEIWHVLKPLIETPFSGGPATWMEDIPLEINRRGFFEETHFTIAYSPVPDESVPGGIGGVLATVHEITEKVVGERRVRALRDLGARSVEPKSADEACIIVRETLSPHPKDIPFLLLYLLDEKRQNARLASCIGADQEDRGCPRLLDLSSQTGEELWPLSDALATEDIQLVEGLKSRFDQVPQGPWSDAPTRAAVLPIRSNIQHQLAGFMIAGLSSRLKFDTSYRDFLELMSTQIATTVASVRAYEEDRKRAEALAEIDRTKTLFFSNVSHEFRTPLTLMLGSLEDTLASGKCLPEEYRNNLEVAHRNSLRLLKLVNTLLDFSRIEARRIQACYEPTDLPGLTVELASLFRSAVERAGLRLLVNCDVSTELAYVDREMWEKIVFNLLSNAFKFTFKGEIEVSLTKVGNGAELRVRDTGTGIPAEDLPHLFERFYRVSGARGRTWEGSGIGLALVQELATLHGGSVRVESELDRGSTFIVTIPLGKDHLPAERIGAARTLASTEVSAGAYVQEALHWSASTQDLSEDIEIASLVSTSAAPSSPERQSQQVSRILLADDNADMRQYLERLLNQQYEVISCEHGQAALERARQTRPDLVLADVMMPRMDGFGLLRALREDKNLRDIPVILLSARAGEESRIEGLDAGADGYLVKPFSARELMARVRSQLAMAEVRREAAELRGRNEEMLRQSEHIRELSWRLLRAQDEERRHIARELHDSAGQTLTVLGMNLAQLVQKAGRTAPQLATEAETIQEMVQQLHRDIRTASYLLHPPLLDESGLYSALSWYTQGLVERSSLEIKLDISQEFGRLPRAMELVVFRLVQECLTNIHRHSGSKTANIRIAREDGQIVLEIEDRGQGMSTQRLAEIQSVGSGVGIRGMRERLSQFNGEMKIESDSKGTRVLVSVPVSKSAAAEDEACGPSLSDRRLGC
jgi:signal transduction histidine kinase